MASVFRQTYTRPLPPGAEIITRKGEPFARFRDAKGRLRNAPLEEDGQRIRLTYKSWYVAYVDDKGQRQIVKGFTDRTATDQLASKLEKHKARAGSGMITVAVDKVNALVSEALDLYLEDLERLGRDETYRYTIRKLIEKLADECGWNTLASIQADKLTRWLAGARRGRPAATKDGPLRPGLAPRTLNEYLETARTFLGWCVDNRYLEGNPLAHIARTDESTDRRRVRRGLPAEELGQLLEAAGPRQLFYLTAMLTGLRKKELRKLHWGDVRLDDPRPFIQLRAKATKAKRPDAIPLPPELVEALAAAKPADAGSDTPVFPTVPTLKTYKSDLDRAGIAYRDADDRQADLHALRMSYNMLLAKEDVQIRVAMRLMRHTDIRLTSKVYTDPTLLDLEGAVEKLPRLLKPNKEETQAEKGAG